MIKIRNGAPLLDIDTGTGFSVVGILRQDTEFPNQALVPDWTKRYLEGKPTLENLVKSVFPDLEETVMFAIGDEIQHMMFFPIRFIEFVEVS